jgi:uncharacterized protein YndB with AHSA1/START domain
MLKIIGILVAIFVVCVFALALRKPDAFAVERVATIKASPDKIYPLITDFHSWASWSPYEKKDLTMKKTYSGSPIGTGAIYEWDGNSTVGKGRMQIVDATQPSKVTIKLDFEKPMEGHNTAVFTLVPKGDSTEVKWAMAGPAPFVSKVMQVFMNFDSMIGDDFAIGLASLKAQAEK